MSLMLPTLWKQQSFSGWRHESSSHNKGCFVQLSKFTSYMIVDTNIEDHLFISLWRQWSRSWLLLHHDKITFVSLDNIHVSYIYLPKLQQLISLVLDSDLGWSERELLFLDYRNVHVYHTSHGNFVRFICLE